VYLSKSCQLTRLKKGQRLGGSGHVITRRVPTVIVFPINC